MAPEGGEINDSPIEQVRITVPITDDKTLPTLTFRTWVLGLTSCILLSSVNVFFRFRQNMIFVRSIFPVIVALPAGKLMAKTLPARPIRIPGTNWTFSMNPGPFSIKEHVLMSTMAISGEGVVNAMTIITQMKVFYHRKINPWAALLLIHTTEMLGFGFAGIFMKFLVDSPYMWWPGAVVTSSFYRALHDVEVRPKGHMTRFQFFLLVSVSSFAYYIVPNYLFPSISALSFVCWIWKDSVMAQQIGSGIHGLGLGSFSLDWGAITSYVSNPLAYPISAIVNVMIGFILIVYIVAPIAYWTNSFNAKRFPFYSLDLFDINGQSYNLSRILDGNKLEFDEEAYDNYSKIYLSTFYALLYGFRFAAITAALTHTALFYGRSTWTQLKDQFGENKGNSDVYIRVMKRNYKSIPNWWFYAMFISIFGLSIYTCEGFGKQLQLPYWGVLLGCALTLIFILPLGVIAATTSQYIELNIISELIIGYLYPGKPIANMTFKSYAVMTLYQAMTFLTDFKQAIYLKIPPRSMFIAQVVSAFISSSVEFGVGWWLLETVDNICEKDKLPPGSPWTCPADQVVFSFSGIWGVAGPARTFAPLGPYANVYYFFLIGALIPLLVWAFSRMFPNKKWIREINSPVILGAAAASMPPAGAVHFWSWFIIGVFFNYFVYRKYTEWWAKYTYVLSAGLSVGIAFLALLMSFVLQDVYGVNWWGLDLEDHCSLAQCPTAPGIAVDGCPVVQ